MAKGKSIVKRRPPPPRTVMDAFDLLKEKGDALLHTPTALALLTSSQLTDVLALYAAWKAGEAPR